MNLRRFAGPALALALLAVLSAAGFSQEDGYKFRFSNFSLEFYGGYSRISPNDFDKHAQYEESFIQFYWVDRLNYLHAIYGDNFLVTSTRTGDSVFQALKKAVPYGLRLRYQASPTLSLSLGVQFLEGTQLSNVGLMIDFQDRRPDVTDNLKYRSFQYWNSGFATQAKAWMPEFGLHFGWNLSAVFRYEISIAFAPMFIQCRTFTQSHAIITMADGYRTDSAFSEEIKGTGTGLSGELGMGLFIRPLKNARLFVEGSYAFRAISELSGPGWNRASTADSNGINDEASASWTGQWLIQRAYDFRSWGNFASIRIQNRFGFAVGLVNNASGNFSPELSGLQVKAGVGFNF